MRRNPILRGTLALVCLGSGFLGLYVGLDFLARIPLLGNWNTGYDVLHALVGRSGPTDLLQDYGGARALLFGGNAYEPTGSLAKRYVEIGTTYLSYVSTHPPTAFLLLVPVAALPFAAASAAWALAMLVGLIVCMRISGASWYIALFLGPLLLLLPPVAAGVNQLAAAWLILAFLAFRVRHRPALASVLIGVASLTKFVPALLVIPLLTQRQWRTIPIFGLVWIGAIFAVAVLNAGAIVSYVSSGVPASGEWMSEPGNGAFLVVPMRYGLAAEVAAVVLLIYVLWLEVREFGAQHADLSWARWSWLAVALLPIAWSFSLLSLALPFMVQFRHRRWPSIAISFASCVPVLLFSGALDPGLPTFVCIAGVGVGLALCKARQVGPLISAESPASE